jgi:hypothetical protein
MRYVKEIINIGKQHCTTLNKWHKKDRLLGQLKFIANELLLL